MTLVQLADAGQKRRRKVAHEAGILQVEKEDVALGHTVSQQTPDGIAQDGGLAAPPHPLKHDDLPCCAQGTEPIFVERARHRLRFRAVPVVPVRQSLKDFLIRYAEIGSHDD